MFEINNSNWVIEYDTLDPDRILQGMYGWVVRANEWHQNADGTDDPITTGRYYSGIFNIGGLIDENLLSAETIMQGNNGADGYEFMRYGPYRPLATIAQPTVCSSMIVHGVAPRENPVLSTMWTALGQANYAIAVPTWVHVSEIPPCLGNGDMAVVVNLLEYVGNETVTQASVFPVEAHLFDEVAELMTRWRRSPSLALRDMGRVETRMADDAYSLLYCLAHVQPDNQAPTVTIRISPQSKCYVQLMGDGIAIDNLSVFLPPSYKYEDDFSTTKAEKDSYDHSAFWPEMAFPPPYPYLFYTHAVQPSGALAFVDYDNVYAHLAYCFPLHHLTSVTDSLHPRRGIMKLEVFDLGDGYGAYSLSGDGVHWTLPMPLEFGAQAITLDPGAGYSYRFVATAEDEDGTIEEYLWDFGDGETASGVSAWHTYDAPGWYLVSCTVTDDDGVSITDWRYLYVRRWIAHEIYPHEVATGGGG
ncbi:MAG: PKD domain-containing protein [Phycisphaerae bacterium]|nr:PKD domain-containing protein [Phycisphaerae bacterium]